MRILVIGAGATGGYFGGRLLQAGRDVTFLVRPRRAAQLAEHGLVIRSPHGDVTLQAPPTVLATDLDRPFDLIVLSCKAYDLADAIESFAPAVGPETMILPLLNGMAHLDSLEARFARAQVLGGKCIVAATLDASGAVLQLNPLHSLTFGEREGGMSPRIETVRDQFAGAGFAAIASDQIVQEMWEKWVFLATLAGATCLMRASVGTIVAAPGGGALMLRLLDECRAIAATNGHAPRAPFLEKIRVTLTEPGSPAKASMMRDIEAGARIEADQIVGDLLRRAGATAGAESTPLLLQTVYCHLKAYEANRR